MAARSGSYNPKTWRRMECEANMAQTLEAIFEDGKFRLLEAPEAPLAQGQRVRITVEAEVDADDVLALAERVYDGLSEEEIEGIEEISLDRRPMGSLTGDPANFLGRADRGCTR